MEFDFDFDREERRSKRLKMIAKGIIWIIVLALTVFSAKHLVVYVLEKTNITSSSMETTLSENDIILFNKMAYFRSEPKRNDIIVFKKDGKEHSYYCVSRVIGVPGDIIQIIEGMVYINGELVEDIVNTEPMKIAGLAAEPMRLDEDEYFVLGDNRNDSIDSRFADMGNITRNSIIGKAWLRTNKFGFVHKLNLVENNDEPKGEE